MSYIDIALTLDSNGLYDISIDDDGDLTKTEGLDTALLMSVLCEKRADESEVPRPEYRRGDWSNELNDVEGYEVGSKLWLLDQARVNQESIIQGEDAILDGLKWLITDNIIKDVDVTGVETSRGLQFTVEVTKTDDKVDKKIYDIFNNTRYV